MARRTVYGNDTSENGWPMVDEGSCQWVTVPGCDVSLEIQQGQPVQILRAWAADINAYVQPLRDADSACWTAGNSVATSNHLSGTALDLDWDDHPMGPQYAGWNQAQINTIRELLNFYEDTVFWGEDWDTPKDSMHFQMGYNTFGNPHTQDFINKKIRADGFSTYRRSPLPPPGPTVDAAQILSDAMLGGVSIDRYRQLLPAVSQCLTDCGCTTVDRIAMWFGQVGEESGGLKWMEEIASGAEYEGRGDLGNTQPGDGTRFKGRGPIQVTGRHNYTVLSQWAFTQGLVPTASFFVDSPERLASDQYGFVGVTWYWTTQRPMNDAADAHDIVRATQYVNGGTNGLADRTNRWNHALGMGDQLLSLLGGTGDDELSAQAEQFIADLHQAICAPTASQSIYADPGEGAVWTPAQIILNDDGMIHPLYVESAARLGDPDAITRVARVAAGKGAVTDPAIIARAQRVLVEIEAANPDVLRAFLAQKGAA